MKQYIPIPRGNFRPMHRRTFWQSRYYSESSPREAVLITSNFLTPNTKVGKPRQSALRSLWTLKRGLLAFLTCINSWIHLHKQTPESQQSCSRSMALARCSWASHSNMGRNAKKAADLGKYIWNFISIVNRIKPAFIKWLLSTHNIVGGEHPCIPNLGSLLKTANNFHPKSP